MKKLIFNISDSLLSQIDIAAERWGFANRAEFMRHAAIEFLRNDGRFIPSDETLKQYSKDILRVKAEREFNKASSEWKKENRYMPKI